MTEQSEYLGTSSQPTKIPTQDEKTIAMMAHALTMISTFLAPLIIYLLKKDESSFVADHAKESLNFQISMVIIYLICALLMLLLVGFFLIAIAGLFHFVMVIVASVRALEGQTYRYPFTIRLI
jgi:uncharacterized protein